MKTSHTIEAQESRKQAEGKGVSISDNREPVSERRRRSLANLKPFVKGVSGNPGGKPKHDLAAELAKLIFEENGPALYRAYLKAALKGNGFVFQTLADRAFGKLKESIAVDVNPLRDLSDEDLKARIAELEAKLGVVPTLPPAEDDPKVN